MAIHNVAVVGAGTMGNGIAHSFAQHGFDVRLIDVSAPALETALATITRNLDRLIAKEVIKKELKEETLRHIHTYTELQQGVKDADLVVEAASENLDIKLKLFQELDQATPPACILASNTSSISISKMAAATRRPEQVIGMHFMNPVPVMKLVEIINGRDTDAEVTTTIAELCRSLKKVPCVVNDSPGFISNRILMPMINEAVLSLQEGVSGVADIDTIMKLGMSHPMGPLQLADFIGLDVCLSIIQVLHDGFGTPKYEPAPLLQELVKAGCLGVKSGEGFYRYTNGGREMVVSPRFQKN